MDNSLYAIKPGLVELQNVPSYEFSALINVLEPEEPRVEYADPIVTFQ